MNYYLSFSKNDTSILKGKIFFAKNHCITIVSDTHSIYSSTGGLGTSLTASPVSSTSSLFQAGQASLSVRAKAKI